MLAALGLLLVACGADVGDSTTTTAPLTTTTAAATTTAPLTTTTAAATTTSADTTTTALAGEPIEFGPAAGHLVMVVGVAYDEVLNLRAAPGVDQPINDEIPPTYTGLVTRGNTRDLSPGFWIEVDYGGTVGWINLKYIAFGGNLTDVTSHVIDELGELPEEAAMTDLAAVVADVFDSDEEPKSDIIQVTEVVQTDLVEVTYDVIGLGDDSVLGFRLLIFAEESGSGFTLSQVEATLLCGRGVSDGICS